MTLGRTDWPAYSIWLIYTKSIQYGYLLLFQISTHFLRHINRFSPPLFTLVLGVACEGPPGVGGVGEVQQLRLQRVLDEVSLLDLPVYWQNLHIVQVQFNLNNCSCVLCIDIFIGNEIDFVYLVKSVYVGHLVHTDCTSFVCIVFLKYDTWHRRRNHVLWSYVYLKYYSKFLSPSSAATISYCSESHCLRTVTTYLTFLSY